MPAGQVEAASTEGGGRSQEDGVVCSPVCGRGCSDDGRMTKVSDSFTWEEMCHLTGEDMDNLLRFYASAEVPSLEALLAMRENPDLAKTEVFDGSFGFSVGA